MTMCGDHFCKTFLNGLFRRRVRRICLSVLLFACSLSGMAQNFTRPNIEGPGGLQVNSYTGSLFTKRADLFIPGRGLSLDLTFSYNSSARDADFGYGYGWTMDWNQFSVPDSSGAGITFFREDGRRDHYLKSGNAWAPPKGIFDVLAEYEPDKFVLKAKNGTQYFFEDPAHRKLTRIRERNGNEIRLSYAGNNLSTLTDASGRIVTFAWTNSRLTEIRSNAASPAHIMRYAYNAAGCLATVTDILGNITSYTYGAGRMMSSVTSPNRFTTNITYHGQAAVAKLISCQLELSVTYNAAQLKTYVIEKGQNKTVSTTYSFDGEGRLIERTGNCCGFKNLYSYDQDNNIASITDANGRATVYTYDKRGNPVSETDPLGQTIFYAYESAFNQITSLTDKAGYKTLFKYDDRGNLLETVNALNITSRFTYDAFGNRLTATNGKGARTAWSYDANGAVATMTDALGRVDTYASDGWGNLLSHTDAGNNKTEFVYDALNRLQSQRDALGGTIKYTYDPNGNRLTVTDARGAVTAMRYNDNDLPIGVTDAANNVTSIEYDAFGNVVTGIDANGFATHNVYDNLNRLVSSTNAAGETTSFTYDANGNRASIAMPNGNTILFTYDPLNRVTRTSDNIGLMTAIEYDANGNRIAERDGNGHTTTYKYDALNRLISASDAAGNAALSNYDENGNLVSETDRNSQATTYTYDELDRRVATTDALRHTTKYAWDALDNMASVTDAKGNVTSYVYDMLSRKTLERFADNSTKAYTYDESGNLLSRKDNAGVVTRYVYDTLNRLVRRDYPGTSETFSYDAVGRMLSAKNANANVAFAYDPVGRLLSETLNGHATSYAYDAGANTKTVTYPGGRMIRRELDSRNRLKTIREGGTSLAEFAYDAAGQLASRRYANNTTTTATYDGAGRITGLTGNPSRFVDLGYSYDQDGNPFAAQFKHLPARSEKYQYDPLGQVTGFQKGTGPQATYNFDAVGNRTTAQVNGATVSYAVNAMNAYTSIGAVTPTYDGNGNLMSDSRNTYTYDFENRMVAVNNGTKASYLYDALGRRSSKIVGADTVNFFYDGQQVIEERTGSDSGKVSYVWGVWIDDIVSMNRNGAAYFYHTNTIGSVTSITSASGAVVERYDYDSWGNLSVFNGSYLPQSTSAIGNAYTFTGQRIEWETGFYFYRARNYDPKHGRFLQRDPLGYVDGLGLYAYVGNRPSTMVDPFGTEGIDYCAELGKLHRDLDILGFIPGYGVFFDLLNASIYYATGDYLNAGLSALSAIPLVGDAFAAARLTLKYGDDAFKLAVKFVKTADNEGNFVYRAITAQNASTIKAGEGIFAKAPDGLWSLEEHLIRGSSPASKLNNPWIATTTDINIAKAFESGHGIVRIDLSKVSSNSIEIGWLTLNRSSRGYHNSIWQQEVSIYRHIPQNAIKIFKIKK